MTSTSYFPTLSWCSTTFSWVLESTKRRESLQRKREITWPTIFSKAPFHRQATFPYFNPCFRLERKSTLRNSLLIYRSIYLLIKSMMKFSQNWLMFVLLTGSRSSLVNPSTSSFRAMFSSTCRHTKNSSCFLTPVRHSEMTPFNL